MSLMPVDPEQPSAEQPSAQQPSGHQLSAAQGRLLFVHAHPDDETINNGATMAAYVAAGHHVTLITSNRG